jgi:hypothetical protein
MDDSTLIDEKKILATLESGGISWRDYFFVGDPDLLCFWQPPHGLMGKIIENNRLSCACKKYVLERGAKRFANDDEVTAAFGASPATGGKPI